MATSPDSGRESGGASGAAGPAMDARWRIIGIVGVFVAVTVGLFLAFGRSGDERAGADLYAEYTGLPWPCGTGVPEWDSRPADPQNALQGRWLSDDDIRRSLTGLAPAGTAEWTRGRLEGLRLWVGALRGAYNWVLDTSGPLLARGPLTAAQERERSTTLDDATARFGRALELTATEISTGGPADWGDMERPTTRLCEGIYTGRR